MLATLPPIDRFRRTVLMTILALSVVSTLSAWAITQAGGQSSPVLNGIFGASVVVLSTLFFVAWRRCLPLRIVGLAVLLYAVGVCATCMALHLYSPNYGSAIDLKPLYLWIPVLYVFAFTLVDYRRGLFVSLGIMLVFAGISLPYVAHDIHAPYANFTVQLHVVSTALIAALYFFSSYQHRLRLAQVTVDQLAHLSHTDELTDVPNRRHMALVVDHELERFAGEGHGFAAILLDIDHFKAVNDQFGHGMGDETLIALAKCATAAVRGRGVLGRWGGDEFLALVRGIGAEDAACIANTLCACFAASPRSNGQRVTISCGVTVAMPGDNIDSMLQRADAALYAAKLGGRNRVEIMLGDEDAVTDALDRQHRLRFM